MILFVKASIINRSYFQNRWIKRNLDYNMQNNIKSRIHGLMTKRSCKYKNMKEGFYILQLKYGYCLFCAYHCM